MESWSIKRVRRGLRGCTPKLSFGLLQFEEGGWFLDLFGYLLSLPLRNNWDYETDWDESCGIVRYGIYKLYSSVTVEWGRFRKTFDLPWDYRFIRCDTRRADGTWATRVQSYDVGEPDNREIQVFDYQYTLKSGEVQHRKATCHIERREWRQRWLKWTSLFAKIRTDLEVEFNGEVGEESGSWKGGCIGCGISMLRGETMEQALRRMESTRKF